ncbi:MAG: hypothetical protein GC159_04355 [Phycisphaera sp.]|nr:hypothetical protein [Phycisphaera sp.]
MTRTQWKVGVIAAMLTGLLLPLVARSADEKPKADSTKAAAAEKKDAAKTDDAAKKDQPSAEEVLNELLRRRSENPLIEPAAPATPTAPGAQPAAIRTIAGTAPALPTGPLRPQGSLVISRRGRMIRASGGMTPWAFVFESDGPTLKDPPMFLMPCEELQQMEQVIDRKQDRAVFEVSGEVYVYRGANYLLPTRMGEVQDRGNLRP